MSDDQRQREPLRDQGDNPPEAGTRSDIGASGDAEAPVAPGGDAVRRKLEVTEPASHGGGHDAPPDPLDDVSHPTADE